MEVNQDVLTSKDNWKDNSYRTAHLIVIPLIVSHPVTYPVNINSVPGYDISLVSFVDALTSGG